MCPPNRLFGPRQSPVSGPTRVFDVADPALEFGTGRDGEIPPRPLSSEEAGPSSPSRHVWTVLRRPTGSRVGSGYWGVVSGSTTERGVSGGTGKEGPSTPVSPLGLFYRGVVRG